MPNVAQYIIGRLEKQVDHAFCFVGGGAIFLIDALNGSTIKPVFLLHEQSCAIAADAYAQTTGKMGLVIVTTGPGVTNALTGVTASYIDSTPVFVLSGQVNTHQMIGNTGVRQCGIQEVPTEQIVSPMVKKVETVTSNKKIDVARQFNGLLIDCQQGRKGPVWLDVPLNMQKAELR
jgi:acetolactate synthase-1/2/3 large subunit